MTIGTHFAARSAALGDPVRALCVGRGDATERLSMTVIGDVGGIGSAAAFSWQATGLLGWRFAEQWTVVAGYRTRGVGRDQENLASISSCRAR